LISWGGEAERVEGEVIASRLASRQTSAPKRSNSHSIEHVRNLLIILVTGLIIVTLAWVGYVGTDDQSYARGALGWLNRFPYLGDNHWALRHPVVIPLAVSLAIFGYREISLGLPSAFFFLVFLGVNYYYLQRFFDSRFGLLASAFMATTPLFAVYATFPQTVVVETLLLSISFWLFYSATRNQEPGWPMFASGVAAGFGFLIRETAGLFVLFYAVLFLVGFGVRRRYYWIMSLGFLLIVGMEMSYFSALTGDPFYRYRVDLGHEVSSWPQWYEGTGDILTVSGNLESGGTIFYPILSLLFNQEFGLLFWVFVPAAIWVCRAKPALEEQRLLRILIGFGIVWMIFISYGKLLAVVPRFYTVSLWTAIIVIAYWVRRYLCTYWPKVAIFVGSGLVAANLLCIYVENKNPAFAERALVAYVVQHDGLVVYTDPTTLRLAALLLDFKGVSDRVRSGPLPPGELFYFNKKNIDYCRRYGCIYSWKDYLPKDGWNVLMRMEPSRKASGALLAFLGLDKVIPTAIFERLDRPNPGGVLYLTTSQ
jgi:4-amino-4-deoxy-L-arabinose transferase-like glycosyltransferase